MRNVGEFISPCPVKTPAMTVQVLDRNGELIQSFEAPPGFQLERYVDSLYPESEFMVYATNKEVNVSVTDNLDIIEIYRGIYKC